MQLWIAAIIGLIASLVTGFFAVWHWISEASVERRVGAKKMAAEYAKTEFGDRDVAAQRGWVRASLPASVALTALTVGSVCAARSIETWGSQPSLLWLRWANGLGFASLFLLGVAYCTKWFNWPKFLVPPHMRSDQG